MPEAFAILSSVPELFGSRHGLLHIGIHPILNQILFPLQKRNTQWHPQMSAGAAFGHCERSVTNTSNEAASPDSRPQERSHRQHVGHRSQLRTKRRARVRCKDIFEDRREDGHHLSQQHKVSPIASRSPLSASAMRGSRRFR